MTRSSDEAVVITPDIVLRAYAAGVFPMAESADDPALYWIEPQQRGILPLDCVHIPKRLARSIRQRAFEVRIDTDFEGVISGCAASRPAARRDWSTRCTRWTRGTSASRRRCAGKSTTR